MLLFVLLIVAMAVLSLMGGLHLKKLSTRRRREFLQGAAQYLGLQYLEGDAAYEQMQRERAEEGLPVPPVPEFLERLTRQLVGPRLTGRFRGSRVSVYEEVHSSRSGSHTESVFKAYFDKPLPFELHLRKEGIGAKLAKAFGGQDVTVGDAALDKAVRLKASPPDAAVQFLKDERRQKAVLAALQDYPAATIGRTHISVSRQGRLKDDEAIKEVLAAIVPVAVAFSS